MKQKMSGKGKVIGACIIIFVALVVAYCLYNGHVNAPYDACKYASENSPMRTACVEYCYDLYGSYALESEILHCSQVCWFKVCEWAIDTNSLAGLRDENRAEMDVRGVMRNL